MLKEFQDAAQLAQKSAQKKENRNILMPAIAGMILTIIIVLVLQYTILFSSSSAQKQTLDIVTTQNQHANSNPKIKINTDLGVILIELFPKYASAVVDELIELTTSGYYNDNTVMESMAPFGFVIAKTGSSVKSFELKAKPNKLSSVRGSLAISKLASPKAYLNNLFVGYQPQKIIQDQYIIIGQVMQGLEMVEKSQPGIRFKIKSFEVLQKAQVLSMK